jgi:hypothetical protein
MLLLSFIVLCGLRGNGAARFGALWIHDETLRPP